MKTALNVLATFTVLLRFFQYDEKEAYENFKQFYEDTLPEFRKAGTVVQFKVTFALFNHQCFEKKYSNMYKMQPDCRNSIALLCNSSGGKPRKVSKRFMQHNAGILLASFALVVLEDVQHNSTLFSNKTNSRLF